MFGILQIMNMLRYFNIYFTHGILLIFRVQVIFERFISIINLKDFKMIEIKSEK